MLKSWGVVVVGGGGLKHFSVSPRPLGFGFQIKGFETKGLGPMLDKIVYKMTRNGLKQILFYQISLKASIMCISCRSIFQR